MGKFDVLLSEEQISRRVEELAKEISADYKGIEPVIVCMLKGSVYFFSDITKKMDLSFSIDFARLSSYKSGTTSGQMESICKITTDIENKHVLIIEDIIDSGKTLNYFLKEIAKQNPASVKLCALLDKPSRRVLPVNIDYLGFTIEDKFIVGYGLDFNEKYRELPYIAELNLDAED